MFKQVQKFNFSTLYCKKEREMKQYLHIHMTSSDCSCHFRLSTLLHVASSCILLTGFICSMVALIPLWCRHYAMLNKERMCQLMKRHNSSFAMASRICCTNITVLFRTRYYSQRVSSMSQLFLGKWTLISDVKL